MKNINKLITAAATVGTATIAALTVANDTIVKRNSPVYKRIEQNMAVITDEEMLALRDKYTNWFDENVCEEHEIISETGEKLKGYLIKSQEPSDKYIFGAHGYRSNARIEFCLFAYYYVQMGLNVFVVDHKGAGQSEGEYIGFGHYESQDCMKWLEYMNETFGEDIQIGLHGVSMGCATVLKMSGNENLPQNVKFVVADCGYTSAGELFEAKLEKFGVLKKPIVGVIDVINQHTTGYSYKQTSTKEAVSKMKIPALFVHGSEDELVPYTMSMENYNLCPMPTMDKELFIVQGSSHATNIVIDGEGYMQRVANYVQRYMK